MLGNRMLRRLRWPALVALCLLMVAAAPARETAQTPAQARALARRAAIVDGQRQLLEIVKGTHIESAVTVREFMLEHDDVASSVAGVLKGAEVVETRYLRDGSCEVDLELPVQGLSVALKRRFPFLEEVLRATGVGAPEPAKAGQPNEPPEPEWFERTIRATGQGFAPAQYAGTARGQRLAERAAQLDALRNLAEHVQGAKIDSKTTVRDSVTKTEVTAFLRGAYPADKRHYEDGSCEVDVAISLLRLRSLASGESANYIVVKEPPPEKDNGKQ